MIALRTPISANLNGALWALVSVAGASVMTVGVRELTPEMHTRMIAFLRSAVGVVFLLPLAVRPQALSRVRMRRPWLHLVRGGLIVLALNSGFYAIAHLPLATATILFFLAPVFSTMLAPLMVGETVGLRRWSAVGLGFLGALIVLRPGSGGIDIASVAAVASSLLFATALLMGKTMSREDGSDAVFLSTSLITAVLTLPIALTAWTWPALWLTWLFVLMVAGTSALRSYADIRSYAAADASFVAPISYLRLPVIGAFGWWFYAERVDSLTILGGLIIAGATLFILVREHQLRGATPSPPAP